MPRWLPPILTRIRELAKSRQVRFTLKAQLELAEIGLGLDAEDACDILERLTEKDSAGRLRSEVTEEWMYVFKPELGGTMVYVKVVLRQSCIIVSFHWDIEDEHEED